MGLENDYNISGEKEKIYFVPGDLVTIRHGLVDKPIMLVKGKDQTLIKSDEGSHFKGIRCFWFTKDHNYQEAVFSTKDLELVNKNG